MIYKKEQSGYMRGSPLCICIHAQFRMSIRERTSLEGWIDLSLGSLVDGPHGQLWTAWEARPWWNGP